MATPFDRDRRRPEGPRGELKAINRNGLQFSEKRRPQSKPWPAFTDSLVDECGEAIMLPKDVLSFAPGDLGFGQLGEVP